MINPVEKNLQKAGIFLDETLLKKSISYKIFCVFFDLSSRITNFLLFDKFGYPLFIFAIGIFIRNYFDILNVFLFNLKLLGFSKIFSILISMPVMFQFGVFFFFFFYQTIFLNTVLAYSKKIQFFMKNKYHENIMKELHYNSGLSSALRSVIPATAAICIFCGKDVIDAVKIKTVSEDWRIVAQDAIRQGQTVPEHPVKVVVHTTSQNTTSINTFGIFENKK